jgi:hypothetical protein
VRQSWLCRVGDIFGSFDPDDKHHSSKFFMAFLSLSISRTHSLCIIEVFIPVKHEGARRKWGLIPLSFYSSTIVYLFVCLFFYLHVIGIFMLLKHEGTRRRWSLTPILFVLWPLLALPPCLLMSIDLCTTSCPLFVLPLQHH